MKQSSFSSSGGARRVEKTPLDNISGAMSCACFYIRWMRLMSGKFHLEEKKYRKPAKDTCLAVQQHKIEVNLIKSALFMSLLSLSVNRIPVKCPGVFRMLCLLHVMSTSFKETFDLNYFLFQYYMN